MDRARKSVAAFVLVGITLLLSGCVYLRLLELKRQISAFDENFVVATDDGIKITCRKPVLLAEDVRWIGLAPETTRKVGSAQEWQVRWIKQLPSEVYEDGAYDIVVEMLFSQEKLTRIKIPERYFAVMPKSLLIDLLRSLGRAKIDRKDRSIEALLAASRPDLPGIEKLLGRPSARSTTGNDTTFRYRYVPATHEGLARAAIFDMAVHFDERTGNMTRWEGQTPVGRIGFNFEDAAGGSPAASGQ